MTRMVRLCSALIAVMLLIGACQTPGPSNSTGASTSRNPIDELTLPRGVEVTFWHSQTGESQKLLESLVDEFNRANEWGIKVRAEYNGTYTQVYQKTLAALQANNPPELAVAYESMASDYQKADKLVPFDAYVASAKYGLTKDDLADFPPAYLEATKFANFNGQQLTFPFAKSSLLLYTNLEELRKLGFSKPPETWDEMLTQLRAANRAGNKGFAFYPSASTFHGMIMSFGGDATTPDGKKTAYDGEAGLKAFRLVETLQKERLAYLVQGFDDQNEVTSGKAIFMIRSSSSIPFLRPLFNDDTKWAATIIPQEKTSAKATVLYGGNVSLFRSTPEKQLASWLFVRWWSSKSVTARWGADKSTGYYPLRLSAVAEPAFKEYTAQNTQFLSALEASRFGKVEPYAAGTQEIRPLVEQAITSVMNGQQTGEQAARQLKVKGDQILADSQ